MLIAVDEDTTSYDKDQIRNAVKVDWTTDLQDHVRHDLVDKEQFVALLPGRGGINDHTLDGRKALDPAQWRDAGWTYRALGRR